LRADFLLKALRNLREPCGWFLLFSSYKKIFAKIVAKIFFQLFLLDFLCG